MLWQQSLRRDMAFVPINCSALSEQLAESELFGHEANSFSGAANKAHKGLFEVANGGTVFLDELGELNKNIQVKLLRFLESGEIRRVGESEPFRVDVRVLCATNKDLRQMVRDDLFREDLYYRLNTFEVHLPPLRERREDLPLLCEAILGALPGGGQVVLSPQTLARLARHDWPGNGDELRSVLETAGAASGDRPIEVQDLPLPLREATPAVDESIGGESRRLADIEAAHLRKALTETHGNKARAARILGLSRWALQRKLQKHRISMQELLS